MNVNDPYDPAPPLILTGKWIQNRFEKNLEMVEFGIMFEYAFPEGIHTNDYSSVQAAFEAGLFLDSIIANLSDEEYRAMTKYRHDYSYERLNQKNYARLCHRTIFTWMVSYSKFRYGKGTPPSPDFLEKKENEAISKKVFLILEKEEPERIEELRAEYRKNGQI